MYADVLKLVLDLDRRLPAASASSRLSALFRALQSEPPSGKPQELEDLIWAIWGDHENRTAAAAMEQAVHALAAKRYTAAEGMLNRLVTAYPDWSEAWNKRATLYFIQNRDSESVADIRRTLELEPRHFGAVSGFGQICLRCGDGVGALASFEAALRINPHLDGLKQAVRELSGTRPRRLN